jgi:hypothetical protein
MVKSHTIMQHSTLYAPCIAFMSVSHTCIFAVDNTEQGREEPPEPTQVESANSEQEQGKPRCI